MTDKIVSVVTALAPGRDDHLDPARDSVLSQKLPPGWSLQWCVQIDGPDPAPAALIGDERILVGHNSTRRGPAITRTMAAARASGEIVKVLDADDVLTAGQLAREVAVFTDHPEIDWIVSEAADLLPDGTLVPHPVPIPPGKIPRGTLFDLWEATGPIPAVHPATLAVRAQALWRAGGWMALGGGEDTGLLLALEAGCHGYRLGEVGLWYRKWPGQITASDTYSEAADRRVRAEAIRRRVRALG